MKPVCEFLLLGLPSLAWAGGVKASSAAKPEDGATFTAESAFDGLLSTAWAEGDLGEGNGSWVEVTFDRAVDVTTVTLWPGNISTGRRSAREYGRPHTVTVTLSNPGTAPVQVVARLSDPGDVGPTRVDVAISGKATTLRVTVDEAYRGGLFNDCAIAEVAVNFVGGNTPAVLDRLATWQLSEAGQRADAKDAEEVAGLVGKIRAEQFGDRDALQELMLRAGDGAPYLRAQARTLVPAGFRLSALPPDPHAVQALLEIGDSNAIPAIERAALRSRGQDQVALNQRVEMFEAYQDLVGANRTVSPWGEVGIAPGALKSLGEPLAIGLDPFGGVWVADTGNHRVQRFGPDGVLQKAWGFGTADITNVWFPKTRNWYAAGAHPTEEAGGFVAPVDLVLVSSKVGTTAWVLDARGRVSVIGEDDQIRTVWKIASDMPVSAGVGGEAHLVRMSPKRFVVVWGNEAVVLDELGAEVSRFDIPDGSPQGAIAVGDRLGLQFAKDLVEYGLDGFRFGGALGDSLGRGFESWDLVTDEKAKLWALTDQGVAIRFKKLGVVDFRVSVSETSMGRPRFAVFDGLLYVTDGDRILRLDALEARRKAELAEEEKVEAAKDPA